MLADAEEGGQMQGFDDDGNDQEIHDAFDMDIEVGDQRGCMDVFKGQVDHSIPSGYVKPKDAGKAPGANLSLKWAHGFRSFDTRGNLQYAQNGNIVFTTAGLGVVYDKQADEQRFFNMHHEDVVAMAMHPDGDIVATGQMAAKQLGSERSNTKINQGAKGRQALKEGKLVDIYIWRASTQEVVAKISGFHRRAVRNLAFSPSGAKLLSLGEDDHHSAAVYDWAK